MEYHSAVACHAFAAADVGTPWLCVDILGCCGGESTGRLASGERHGKENNDVLIRMRRLNPAHVEDGE